MLEPRDIIYGPNMFDQAQQREVFYDIEQLRPKLLWVALPCTKWSPWQRLNYAQRRQQLRRERSRQRKLVRFAADCAWKQLELGNEVIFEHPKSSDMWVEPLLQDFMEPELGIHWGQVDMCRYNMRAVSDGGYLKKPTTLMCSDYRMIQELQRTCEGGPHTNSRSEHPTCRSLHQGVLQSRGEGFQGIIEECVGKEWRRSLGSFRQWRRSTWGFWHFRPRSCSTSRGPSSEEDPPELGTPFLARHLRLSGAADAVVGAAQGIRCTTC